MQFTRFLVLFTLLAAQPTNAADLSPVSRVVELLRSLSKQIEKDGETEENLYETYVCWGKSVIEQKTASNAAANSKIEQLTTYIADLESGRIEVTSERADLEKEIEELMGDMEMADAMRKKENTDFLEAEDEMTKAVKALDSAVKVLGTATKDHKEGVLMAVRAKINAGTEAFSEIGAIAEQQTNLKNAVEFGKRFLNKGDALFLQRVLLGDVPNVDWKKLNRKATFKMNYKARSFKIQEVLKKMHQTFSTNLKDAQDKEKASKDSYDTLTASKQGQLDSSRKALSKMESENGVAGMNKQDAKDELKSLKAQVVNDERFIKETTTALDNKKKEWKTRSNLRQGELEAISKAIQILHNDNARDLMKRSGSSQLQMSFLQTGSTMAKANGAAAALREAAKKSGDKRLATLAVALADPKGNMGDFKPVIDAVDKMIAILKSDEEKDNETKERCEKDRMADTKKAIDAGRAIDDMTDKMTKLTEEIANLKKEIADLQAEWDQVDAELKKAKGIRKDENAAWKLTDKDDEDAAATVANAKKVIEDFYKDNQLVFVQAAQPAVTAGDAPPPPPSTWEGGYGGKTGESMGIVALLGMVHEDIQKDRATAKSEEDASQKEFNKFKSESEAQMKELQGDMNDREKTKGKKETELTQTEKSRRTKKGELDGTLTKINDINPNCEYYTVNYPLRKKNRQIELDGLNKAKAILSGGVFAAPEDASREITPGDAFLQRRA